MGDALFIGSLLSLAPDTARGSPALFLSSGFSYLDRNPTGIHSVFPKRAES